MNKVIKYLGDRKSYFIISMVLALISGFLAVLPFYFIYKLLLALIIEQNYQHVFQVSIEIMISLMVYAVVYFIALICSHISGFRIETNMRKFGVSQLKVMPLSFYDNNNSGTIRKNINDNAKSTHNLIAHQIPDLMQSITVILFSFILMFKVDVYLGIAVLGMLILSFYCTYKMMGDPGNMDKYMKALDQLNAECVEYVRAIQVVKVFSATVYSLKNFHKAIKDYARFALDYAFSARWPYVFNTLVLNGFFIILIVFGYAKVQTNNSILMIVNIFVFLLFTSQLTIVLTKILYVGEFAHLAFKSIDRLEKLFDDKQTAKVANTIMNHGENDEIVFKNVSFAYNDEKKAINDMSFKIKKNEKIALVGSSGSGKSTIIKLLTGHYTNQEGLIAIRGKRNSEMSLKQQMDMFSVVSQNSKLFPVSIYENVAMGNPEADEKTILEALGSSQCNDIIDRLPEGVNTVYGSRGVHFSGGEVQRLAIARCLIKDAPIIILDEAFAAADPENEVLIHKSFEKLLKDKTVIICAHRISNIKNVDRIFCIEQGQIVEEGSHLKLMKKKGRYYKFVKLFEQSQLWRLNDEK